MAQINKLILNTITFLIVLIVNYFSNTDIIGKMNVGEISEMYPTVITPAGYAFSIWGLIYLLLVLFIGYMWYSWIKKIDNNLINRIGSYFLLSNLANTFWIFAWVNGYIGFSFLFILLLLFSLFKLVHRLNLEKCNSSLSYIFFIRLPITIYFGWVILAAVLNFNVYLVSSGDDIAFLNTPLWGIILIIVSTSIYVYLVFRKNLWESSLVGIWGLTAIIVNQIKPVPVIGIWALGGIVSIFISIIYHVYRNKKMSDLK